MNISLIDCPCLLNSTISITANEDKSQRPRNGSGLFIMAFYVFFFLLLLISCLHAIFVKIMSRKSGQITREPFVPRWLGLGQHRERRQLDCGIRVETRDYRTEYASDRRGSSEKEQGAIKWIQSILKKKYGQDPTGRARVYVPQASCLIQVPMTNFKCGVACTDFEPEAGVVAGSHFTYQMCGKERLQITRYVEDDVEYVAGFCVYIQNAYDSSSYHSKMHIKKCYTGPVYVPKVVLPVTGNPLDEPVASGPSLAEIQLRRMLERFNQGREDSELLSEELDNRIEVALNQDEAKMITKRLKSNFCEMLERPVFLGVENGVVRHYEWNVFFKKFNTSYCPSCEVVGVEEDPPPYHLLDV